MPIVSMEKYNNSTISTISNGYILWKLIVIVVAKEKEESNKVK